MEQCGLDEWGRRTLPDTEKTKEVQRNGGRVGIQSRYTTKRLCVTRQGRTTAVQRCSFLGFTRTNVLGNCRLHAIEVGADLEILQFLAIHFVDIHGLG